MNERVKELAEQAGMEYHSEHQFDAFSEEKFAELLIRECVDQVEQAKKSPFVSLDDAKRMAHFVDVTTKKIQKHFGVE